MKSNVDRRDPSCSDLPLVVEEEVEVGDVWRLPGTIAFPCEELAGLAGLVLVPGSGPCDRDASVGRSKPFRDIARGVAGRGGVAVLRYDKRTYHYAHELARKLGSELALKEELIDDGLAGAELLRSREEIDRERIYVLGYSLGGMAIPRIAAADKTLAGFIILGGSTGPLEDSLLRQTEHVTATDGSTDKERRFVLNRLRGQVTRVKQLREGRQVPAAALPFDLPAAYWLDLARHPPAETMAREDRPVLVLHGDRDYQVTLDDFHGWQQALAGKANATLRRYPNLNHLFIAGRGPSTPAEYLRPGTVAEEVVADIASWILARR